MTRHRRGPDCPLDGVELAALAAQGRSLVVFDDDLEPDGFDVVRQDRARACRAAIERLIAAGHRRIAFLAHADEHGDAFADVKLRSYRDGLAAHDIAADPELVRPVADSRSDAYAAVRDLLRSPAPRPRCSRPPTGPRSTASGRPATWASPCPTSSPSSASATSRRA